MKNKKAKAKRTYEPQIQALLLHRKLQAIRNNALERLEKEGFFKELEEEMTLALQNEKLDAETLRHLKKLLGEKREMSEMERIRHAVDLALENRQEQIERINEHTYPLTLTQSGVLCRSQKEECNYPLQSPRRIKLLRTLNQQTAPCASSILQEVAECQQYKDLTFMIGEINKAAHEKLGLPKKERLIVSFRPQGYALNELYPITEEV